MISGFTEEIMRRLLLMMAGFLLFVVPARADMYSLINICAQSYPTDTGAVLNCMRSDTTGTTSIDDSVTYDTSVTYGDTAEPAGNFSGFGSVSMTPDTFRFIGSVDLQDYARKNRVNIDDPFVLQGMSLALGSISDSIIVGGGSGVYTLNYVLSVDGTFTSDPDFFGFFCGNLIIPQGQAGATSGFCAGGGAQSITLSYGNLQFGAPVAPTLQMNVLTSLNELSPDEVATLGDTMVTGSSLVDYGSTVRLQNLLITDASGKPISGVTIQSASGYTYALDPRNTASVPEPSTSLSMVVGLAAIFALKRRSMTSSSNTN
jgi:hypothetical protein